MHDIVYGHRFKLAKCVGVVLLILAHLALTTPLPEAEAMESANFRVSERATTSGSAADTPTGAKVPYASVGEACAGSMSSVNFKAELGYIPTIASNPPVLKALVPDKIIWNKGEAKASVFSLDDYFTSPDNSALTYIVEGASKISSSFDADSKVSFSQGASFYGIEKVRFIAIDENKNRTKSNTVALIVKAPGVNNPPVIFPLDDVTSDENELIQLKGSSLNYAT